MEYWGPLIQTALWVVLFAGITWRFHRPIERLIEVITERIKSGSEITAGPLSLKSQSVAEQVARAKTEHQEAILAAQLTKPAAQAARAEQYPNPALPPSTFKARYFQAEDLALRAVQAEFKEPILRQVTGGPNSEFDGAFVSGGRLNVVEVKYFFGNPDKKSFKKIIERYRNFLTYTKLPSVNLMLVAVIDGHTNIESVESEFNTAAKDADIDAVVRVYEINKLKREFGVDETD